MTAQCSLHPDSPAELSCARCGRFCCTYCVFERQTSICRTCAPAIDPYQVRGRRLDPLHGAMTALKLVREEWPSLLIIAVLFATPLAVFDFLLERRGGDETRLMIRSIQLSAIYDTLFGIIGTLSMVALFIARLEGRRLSLGQALREASLRWMRGVRTSIRVSFTLFFFTLLLIVPGIWKLIMFAWTTVAIMRVSGDPVQASEALVRGRLGQTVLYGLVATLPVAFLNGMFGIALEMVAESFELPLVGPRIITGILDWALAESFALAMLSAGFVMAHRDAELPLESMTWNVAQPPLANEK